MAARELRVEYRPRTDLPFQTSEELRSPQASARLLTAAIGAEAVEVFVALFLTSRFTLLCLHEVGRGRIDSTPADPRDVFKAALLANAACMIVGHNHPSGDPSPSPEDLNLTRRLIDGGKLLGIPVLDHIVIGHERYFSFKEFGILPGF